MISEKEFISSGAQCLNDELIPIIDLDLDMLL